jgi:predicted permease
MSILGIASGIHQDVKYGLRSMRRERGFTAFAVTIIGLGIGASATVFSVVNTLLLRPLPFAEPERLAWVANRDSAGLSGQTTQVGHLLDLREQTRTFAALGAYFAFYGVGDNLLSGQGEAERLSGVPVSDNFFQVLGVKPQVGRLFTAEECKWNGPKAVLLSHGLWQRRFAANPGVVGRTLIINEQPVTVVGVLPDDFDMGSVLAPGSRFDLFVPFPLSPETNRWGNTMAIIGRLKPGVSIQTAQAEIRALARQITAAHPERNSLEGVVTPLAERVSGRIRPALLVLSCAVGVVMLIVCANLSNLLLARTATRQKELAVRTALGAGWGRLIRQMLTEGITLSACGAALGVALAWGGTRLLASLQGLDIPLVANVRLDAVSLGYCVLAALTCGSIFGLAPALQARTRGLHDVLKDAPRGSTSRVGGWVRNVLVVSEISFACVLLVAAALLIRSFERVLDVSLGFRPERAMAMRVDPDSRYKTEAEQNAYFNEVLGRVRGLRGIEAAGLSDFLPLGRNRSWGAPAKGQTYPRGQFPTAFVRVVSDGYLKAMGIPLVEGRDLDERDAAGSSGVILINETLARRLWPGQNALGQVMRACGERTVVGVARDVRHLSPEEASGMEMYIPIRQCRDFASLDLVVRSSLPPSEVAQRVRASLWQLAPNLPVRDFRTLQQLVDRAVSPRRFLVWLLGGFATFALVLASLGIYGVVSYGVTQRTQEIGIRVALGAPASRLQFEVLSKTLGLAAAGGVIGMAVSRVLSRSFASLLFGVTAGDPVTAAAVPVLLALVAVIAGWLPARRASRIDPAIALRSDR